MDDLLSVQNLRVRLLTAYGVVQGVRGVSLSLGEGEAVGIVGESGCGKTLTAKSILRLLPKDRAEISGKIIYSTKDGRRADILTMKQSELLKIRGSEISMVLQDSAAALSPIITVGRQMEDVILAHKKLSRAEARNAAERLLGDVGIPEPALKLKSLPDELSGGQLQRVCIAMAISPEPRLLLADEPTTALDTVTQAQILALLKKLSKERKMAILIVTHNFSVVKRLCDRVYVMYAGLVAESGSAESVKNFPAHRYTRDLLKSIPDGSKTRLRSVPGALPDVYSEIVGCPYAQRCAEVCSGCNGSPQFKDLGGGHFAACVKAGGEAVE